VDEDDDLGHIPYCKREGLVIANEMIPWLQVEEFRATSKEDLLVVFKEVDGVTREPVELTIAEKSAHILLSLPHMIATWLCQSNLAELDEKRENVLNGPKFNFKKIAKSSKEAYAVGG
jgi:hypothetical protein